MTREAFRELVKKGPVLLDGATGTNLQKAGMPVGVCPEQWILENSEVLIDLQKQYVEAGTDILFAPTFTASRIKLKEYGLEDHLETFPALHPLPNNNLLDTDSTCAVCYHHFH